MCTHHFTAGLGAVAAGLLLPMILPIPAYADWQGDGNPVSTAAQEQRFPVIAVDGGGGVFVAWDDYPADIFGTRIGPNGVVPATGFWPPSNGKSLTNHTDGIASSVVPDGSGGFFVSWEGSSPTPNNVRRIVQHWTSIGTIAPGWPAGGVVVCDVPLSGSKPVYKAALVLDGGGGVFVAWSDHRLGNMNIYVNHVTSGAAIASGWPLDGVAVCTAPGDQIAPDAVGNGLGGIIVAWEDKRAGNGDIYAQRLSGAGVPGWAPTDGVAVCTAPDDQFNFDVVTDGMSGAILTWMDYRTPPGRIYAARITSSGSLPWLANGNQISFSTGEGFPKSLSDGAGGAFVTWSSFQTIWIQRLNSSGGPAIGWLAGGRVICDADGFKAHPQIASDGA